MAVKDCFLSTVKKMHRKQALKQNALDTPLKRCLTVFELTFVGLSLMINGIFLTTPTVVSVYAGPGVILSFLLAGIAAVLSAFSYAEMGSRVPRAGSGYVYVSVALGEIWGFLAGWNMVLEYALTCAAMSRSFTSTLLLTIAGPNRTLELDIDFTIFGEKTDIVAACVVILFAIIVATGVRLASILNAVMNFTALCLVLCVSVISFVYGDPENWGGSGISTFFPHGLGGVIAGGSICYFSYIGFESITISSEEALKPHKSIPMSIVLVFIIVTTLYLISSLAFTFFTPASEFEANMPLAKIFLKKDFPATAIVIGIAGILAVCTNILICLNSIPRVTYAMSSDGLLFKPFAYINSKTQTPLIGMVFAGLFVATMTFIFELQTLIEAVSVGTLLSYILVAIGVIILRFEPVPDPSDPPMMIDQDFNNKAEADREKHPVVEKPKPGTRKVWVKKNKLLTKYWPDIRPTVAVGIMVFFMIVLAVVWAIEFKLNVFTKRWNAAISTPILTVIVLFLMHLFLYEQKEPDDGTFKIPGMPLIPAISIQMNLIFMMMLSHITWIRLVVWVAIGLIIYFAYGIRYSVNKEEGALVNDLAPHEPQKNYGSNHTTPEGKQQSREEESKSGGYQEEHEKSI